MVREVEQRPLLVGDVPAEHDAQHRQRGVPALVVRVAGRELGEQLRDQPVLDERLERALARAGATVSSSSYRTSCSAPRCA